jgi:hypothetical protein
MLHELNTEGGIEVRGESPDPKYGFTSDEWKAAVIYHSQYDYLECHSYKKVCFVATPRAEHGGLNGRLTSYIQDFCAAHRCCNNSEIYAENLDFEELQDHGPDRLWWRAVYEWLEARSEYWN